MRLSFSRLSQSHIEAYSYLLLSGLVGVGCFLWAYFQPRLILPFMLASGVGLLGVGLIIGAFATLLRWQLFGVQYQLDRPRQFQHAIAYLSWFAGLSLVISGLAATIFATTIYFFGLNPLTASIGAGVVAVAFASLLGGFSWSGIVSKGGLAYQSLAACWVAAIPTGLQDEVSHGLASLQLNRRAQTALAEDKTVAEQLRLLHSFDSMITTRPPNLWSLGLLNAPLTELTHRLRALFWVFLVGAVIGFFVGLALPPRSVPPLLNQFLASAPTAVANQNLTDTPQLTATAGSSTQTAQAGHTATSNTGQSSPTAAGQNGQTPSTQSEGQNGTPTGEPTPAQQGTPSPAATGSEDPQATPTSGSGTGSAEAETPKAGTPDSTASLTTTPAGDPTPGGTSTTLGSPTGGPTRQTTLAGDSSPTPATGTGAAASATGSPSGTVTGAVTGLATSTQAASGTAPGNGGPGSTNGTRTGTAQPITPRPQPPMTLPPAQPGTLIPLVLPTMRAGVTTTPQPVEASATAGTAGPLGANQSAAQPTATGTPALLQFLPGWIRDLLQHH